MSESCTKVLRSEASNWSLNGDKQLLDVLQGLHQKIIEKCQETNKQLEIMVTALDEANIHLQNVNNKFTALSNTQFIESRVYDDDGDVTNETEQPKVQQDEKDDERESLRRSLQVLESLHETVTIVCDSETESDTDDEDTTRVVLKPKDLYADRPLPYIIGTQAWKSKWHAGLVRDESESDSASEQDGAMSQYSESDSEPSAPRPAPAPAHTRASPSISSSELESEADMSIEHRQPTQSDIAAELARKLGGGATKMPEPAEAPTAPPPARSTTVYRPHRPLPGNVFLDEPPPLEPDQSEESDQDDIFAEIHKKQPYSHSAKDRTSVADDLFGPPVFDDAVKAPQLQASAPVKQKTLLFEDESEPEPFAEKQQNKAHDMRKEDTAIKKPVGGMSLFGSNADSIGAAILKRNQRQTSLSDEESEPEPQIKHSQKEIEKEKPTQTKERDIFEDLFSKSEKITKTKNKTPIKIEKEPEVVQRKVDIFSDNIFDDIDDIFTTNIKVASKNEKKSAKSIFEYDDLFPVATATTKDNKSISKNDKNIFDDGLFDDAPLNIPSKPIEDKNKFPKATKSLFDDSDDDLFSDTVNQIKTKTNDNYETVKEDVKNEPIREDDNIFGSIHTKVQKEMSTSGKNTSINDSSHNPSKIKSSREFEEDEYDLFQSTENKSNIDENNENLTVSENNLKDGNVKSQMSKVYNFTSDGSAMKNEIEEKTGTVDDNVLNNTDSFSSKPVNIEKEKSSFEASAMSDTVALDRVLTDEKQFFEETQTVTSGSGKRVVDSSVTPEPLRKPPIEESNVIKPNVAKKPTISKKESNKTDLNDDLDNMQEVDANKNITDIIFEKVDNKIGLNKSEVIKQSPPDTKKNQDAFSDIFEDQPPVFEKPKEPKKSRNVNALFDDDSDDESLFFKKNDIITDDRPEGFVSGDDRLFGLFRDEPPAIDVDFVAKPNKTEVKPNFDDMNVFGDDIFHKGNVKQILKTHTESIYEDTNENNLFGDVTDIVIEKKCDKPDSDQTIFTNFGTVKILESKGEYNVKEEQTEKEKKLELTPEKISEITEPKKIGKLKTINFSIDVNTLLPGASPKKVAKTDDLTDGQTPSRSNDELHTKNLEHSEETKIVKSISFDGKPDPAILDNKLSKERAKIQVKRRPSTRRARREAAKKSVIEFGEDSTDNSSSVDDPPKTNTVPCENKTFSENIAESISPEVSSPRKDLVIVEDTCDSLNSNDKKPEPEHVDNVATSETDPLEKKENPIDVTVAFSNPLSERQEDVFSEVKTESAKNIKSKVVYVLNDEDIFDTKPKMTDLDKIIAPDLKPESNDRLKDSFQNINEGITIIGQIYKESKPEKTKTLELSSDSGDELFRSSNTIKKANRSDSSKDNKIPKADFKQTNIFDESDDELFTNKPKEQEKKKTTLFGSDSDEELFGGAKKAKGTEQKKMEEKHEPKEKKEVKRVSLFDDDEDSNLFVAATKKATASKSLGAHLTNTKEVSSKSAEPVFQDPLSLFGSDED